MREELATADIDTIIRNCSKKWIAYLERIN
jgi:hypothetical protein